MTTPLVRGKEDRTLTDHNSVRVHTEMMLQIAMDYAGLPDIRTLTASEIRFFYEGSRGALKRYGG